jgi:hypothetical protein
MTHLVVCAQTLHFFFAASFPAPALPLGLLSACKQNKHKYIRMHACQATPLLHPPFVWSPQDFQSRLRLLQEPKLP